MNAFTKTTTLILDTLAIFTIIFFITLSFAFGQELGCNEMVGAQQKELMEVEVLWGMLTPEQRASKPEIVARLDQLKKTARLFEASCGKDAESEEAKATDKAIAELDGAWEIAAAATEVVLKAALSATAEAVLKPAAKAEPEAEAEAEEEPKVYHFAEDDLETGRVLGDTLKAGSYAGKCLLVTVISATESYHRDLAATVQGDLADGALMLRRNLVNEIGAIAFKAGPNSVITLQEDNSNFLFTSMSEKARGVGIEEFAANAAKARFLVMYESGVECLGSTRDEDLKKMAEAHLEALRLKRERMAEIAKR